MVRKGNIKIVLADGGDKRLLHNANMRERRKNWSPEEVERNRELSKIRMRELRERKKKEKENNPPTDAKKTWTRAEMKLDEERRKKQREKKRTYRKRLSGQKKRRIREADRLRKRLSREAKEDSESEVIVEENRVERNYVDEEGGVMNEIGGEGDVMFENNGEMGLNENLEENVQTENYLRNVVKTSYESLKGKSKSKIRNRRIFLNVMAGQVKNKYQLQLLSKLTSIPIRMLKNRPDMQKRKRRSDAIDERVVKIIEKFYKKEENAINIPNTKLYSGSKTVPQFILQKSLKQLYNELKNEHPAVKVSFSKFCFMRPEEVKTQDFKKLIQCLCEKCENIELKLKVLNRLAKGEKFLNKYEVVQATMCEKGEGKKFNDINCITRKCGDCGIKILKEKLELENTNEITWSKWGIVKVKNPKSDKLVTKRQLQNTSGNIKEFLDALFNELESFSEHLFIASWQQEQFRSVNKNIPTDSIVITADFSENYTCFSQNEVQGAHWSKDSVTIHPTMLKFNCKKCENTHEIEEMYDIVSDDLIHDSHTFHVFLQNLLNHHKKVDNADLKKIYILTDGCSSQYKCKSAFLDCSYSMHDFGLSMERAYYGSGHGKNRCDGEGGIIKTCVSRAVKNESAIVNNAYEFYEVCNKKLSLPALSNEGHCRDKRRTIVYIPSITIDHNRPRSQNIKTVPGTRRFHSVKSASIGEIFTRELSCFCNHCINEQPELCCNQEHVKEWKKHVIKTTTVEDDEESIPQINLLDTSLNVSGASCNLGEPSKLNDSFLDIMEQTPEKKQRHTYEVGDFVSVFLPFGKSKKEYVAEIVEVDSDTDYHLIYMEEFKEGIYKWPITIDSSIEPRENLSKKLDPPHLIEELSSSRTQYFKFSKD